MTDVVLALNWEDGLWLFLLFNGVGVDIFLLLGVGLWTIVIIAIVIFKKFQSILIILNSFRLNTAVRDRLTSAIFHLAVQPLSKTRTQRRHRCRNRHVVLADLVDGLQIVESLLTVLVVALILTIIKVDHIFVFLFIQLSMRLLLLLLFSELALLHFDYVVPNLLDLLVQLFDLHHLELVLILEQIILTFQLIKNLVLSYHFNLQLVLCTSRLL